MVTAHKLSGVACRLSGFESVPPNGPGLPSPCQDRQYNGGGLHKPPGGCCLAASGFYYDTYSFGILSILLAEQVSVPRDSLCSRCHQSVSRLPVEAQSGVRGMEVAPSDSISDNASAEWRLMCSLLKRQLIVLCGSPCRIWCLCFRQC